MGTKKRVIVRGIAALAATLALTAGTAWASETLTAPVPGAQASYGIEALLVAGVAGGEVIASGHHQDDDVNMRIRVDASGAVTINGEYVASTAPAVAHKIEAYCYQVGGMWVADIVIRRNDTGTTVHFGVGRAIGTDRGGLVAATGQTVTSLSVD